ncbi:MAG: hypothetical protein U5P10_08260 [Spirochaetia bacterium]|nr:hypothetical protein [Spirochaetia bacterium]
MENIRGLELQHGERYVVMVRATNGVGLQKIGSSGPIMIDTTAPEKAEIESFEQQSIDAHPNSFHFSFTSPEDPESGIAVTSFALGTSGGESDLWEWTDIGDEGGAGSQAGTRSLKIVQLPVQEGQEVYLTVRGTNRAYNASEAVASATVSFSDSSPPEGLRSKHPA